MFKTKKRPTPDIEGVGVVPTAYTWTGKKDGAGSTSYYPYALTIKVVGGKTIRYNTAANEADAILTARKAVERYVRNADLPEFIEGKGTV